MYYMWINKNLVHQVGDQTKVSLQIQWNNEVKNIRVVKLANAQELLSFGALPNLLIVTYSFQK